jgi:catechol 2,3-dioxygenase-like lactoylglutathione lyase family enzyme
MKIDYLQLVGSDLDSLESFYRDTLGLPCRRLGQELHIQAGATELCFTQAAPEWSGGYHFAFNIPENQYDEAKDWLAARAPVLKGAAGQEDFHFESWDAHAFYFRDPAGNILEFIARHALANSSVRPFGPDSILNVSEIGLPTEHVVGLVGDIEERCATKSYRSVAETFAALGDEQGLFILVKSGREWHPDTNVFALEEPLTVRFREGGDIHTLLGLPYRFDGET